VPGRLDAQPEPLRQFALLRAHEHAAVLQADGGQVIGAQGGAFPVLRQVGLVGRDPLEGHLVAPEEAAQVVAGSVEALAAQHGTGPGRLRGQSLQAADAFPRLGGHPLGDVGHRGSQRVILRRVDAQQPGRLRRAGAAEEGRAEGDRHLAVEFTGLALADHGRHAIDLPHDLELARDHDVERTFLALVHGEFARHQVDVGRRARQRFQLGDGHTREQGHIGKFGSAQHGGLLDAGVRSTVARGGAIDEGSDCRNTGIRTIGIRTTGRKGRKGFAKVAKEVEVEAEAEAEAEVPS